MKEPNEPPPEVLEYETQERKRSRNPFLLIAVVLVLGLIFGGFFLYWVRWDTSAPVPAPLRPAPTSGPAGA